MSNGPIIEDFQLIQDNENDARLKDKSRKRVSRACVYCQRSHMSCDEGRPCKRCLSRGMGELCRDGKCKRRGRKRKSELANSADEDELSTESVEKKVVSAPRGRPRKVSPFANPAQMGTGQRFEYGERPMYITSQTADAIPPTLAVVSPQQQSMTMGMDPRIQYYTPNPVMTQVKLQQQQQQQPRVDVTVNENSMGSVFSSYNMYPSVPVPMFGNSQNYAAAKYEESCDPSMFLTGDYPPGLIESRYQQPGSEAVYLQPGYHPVYCNTNQQSEIYKSADLSLNIAN